MSLEDWLREQAAIAEGANTYGGSEFTAYAWGCANALREAIPHVAGMDDDAAAERFEDRARSCRDSARSYEESAYNAGYRDALLLVAKKLRLREREIDWHGMR
jgi:hypothetical protein